MSTCIVAQNFGQLWVGNHDPGVNEIPESGAIQVNNNFMNSSTLSMFLCTDNTPEAQVWVPYPVLFNTGVSAGTYANATITVDAQGRVTQASNG